jgi:16S rRNA (cytidine1402-2'-O)-methyltransferase
LGFPSNNIIFTGFLPLQPGKRRKALTADLSPLPTLVCYESPWRIRALLADIATVATGAQVCIAREMTKSHEEYILWHAGDVQPEMTEKGEFTVVVYSGGAGDEIVSGSESIE